MRKSTGKALYLFLCSILGMILLTMLHRAIFVLWDILLGMNFQTFSLGLNGGDITTIDFITFLLALFFGGWYGVALGLEWYAMVYGPNADKPARYFHSFLPHHMRGKKLIKKRSTQTPHTTLMPVATAEPEEVKVPVREFAREWSFDDFLTPRVESTTEVKPKKRAVRKTTARKTTARKTTKRTKVIAE